MDLDCPNKNHPTPAPISGLIKVAHWLSHRRRSKELIVISPSPTEKQSKTKFGFFDEKVAHKKLKHFFKTASKRSSSTSSNSENRATSPAHPSLQTYQRPTCLGTSSPARYFAASLVVPTLDTTCVDIDDPNICENAFDDSETDGKPSAYTIDALTRPDESGRFGKHNALAKARTLSIEHKKAVCERLCATWPQSTTVISSIDDFLPEKDDYDKNFNPSRRQSRDLDVEEAIKEWSIPYKDLHFEKPLRVGQNGVIYKGHWHGEVLIHTFKDTKDDDVSNFWDTIAQLCMVRHENIVLFMGACVDSPNLSVITSMRKGISLLEHIHVKHQVISPPNRINIARQIAQAMGYLHAKGIIHKRLTSNNIILESKVKICLIDQGSAIYSYNGSDYGAVTRGYLSYLCPQLMRCIKVEPPFIKYNGRFSPESDVYAFGTILFELMTGKFPYQRLQSHSIIWLIGNGHHESVLHIKGSNVIRNLVASCWSPLSGQRPAFSQIVKQLQENISLNKKHSCSEPERLNKIGLL
ncbi:kinase suppressor of Ras 2 isoform X2 [Tetranychus urticae]|uniref:kinase suppressor of Ras 2 isoform X2 n=1 Tax=Tetranychus urticae TaxID=32264 RepID=UPI00077BB638|nr:kinase suppressor of Ras 2 isoform X2 [Tetranychus urticae]